MNGKTAFEHIISTPDIADGKPRIKGRRITVQNVVVRHKQLGYSVDEIAMQYNLTLSEIYSALAYYYDHKAEVDRSIAESVALTEEIKKSP